MWEFNKTNTGQEIYKTSTRIPATFSKPQLSCEICDIDARASSSPENLV